VIAKDVRTVLKERIRIAKETQDNWDYGIEQCCKEEIDILSRNMNETIMFFDNECTDEDFFWLSEVFEDIAEKTQSREFVEALRIRLAKVTRENYNQSGFESEHMRKYVDYDEYVRSVSIDIDYSESSINEDQKIKL